MSTNNISSTNDVLGSYIHTSRSQRHKDFIALAAALNSADLAAAQAAFAAFQKDINNASGANRGLQSNQLNLLQQRSDSFQSLAQALNSGHLATAQKAFSAFREASQNIFLARNNVGSADTTPSRPVTAVKASAGDDMEGGRDNGSSVDGVQFSA